MSKRLILALAALPLACATQGAPADFVMVAPADLSMPTVQFQDGALSGGILKDLGEAIAQRLGRRAAFLTVEVDGVAPALTQGRADGVCYVLPHWIDGDFHWTRPMIPDAELVVSNMAAPPIRALSDLRDIPVGTVITYRYPRVENVLGIHFLRQDAPSIGKALQKIMGGKVQYTLISEASLAYELRADPSLKLRADLVFSRFKAQCAFSRHARLPFKEIDRAVDSLIDDGSVERILARYR